MAEYVEQRLEKTIPELEELKRLDLYTDSEIRKIISRRTEFEYKIHRFNVEKKHFLSYIEYEINLLENIRLRRLKNGVEGRKNEIEQPITSRIIKLYEECLKRFKHEDDVWLSFIKYTTSAGFTEKAASVITRMIEANPSNSQLWKAAALWHINQGSLADAESLILKGLQFNPENAELYVEVFKIELMLDKKRIENESEGKCFSRVMVIFESVVKFLRKIDILCDLLNLTDDYDKSGQLQFDIINILKTNFPDDEHLTHTLALRELSGKHFDKNHPTPLDTSISDNQKLKNARLVYSTAIEKNPSPKMWDYCLNTITTHPLVNNKTKLEILTTTFDSYPQFMLAEHFLALIELSDDLNRHETMFTTAVEQYPTSVQLWCEYICLHIKNGSTEKIEQVFDDGVSKLKSQSLPLWEIVIRYFTIPSLDDRDKNIKKLMEIYKKGIASPYTEVSEPLKVDYIKWLTSALGEKIARQEFIKIVKEDKQLGKKPSLNLINCMYELETILLRPNKIIIKKLLEDACKHYGDTHVDVWINFIKFQFTDDPKKVSFTYETAKRTLLPQYRNEFDIRFRILQMKDV